MFGGDAEVDPSTGVEVDSGMQPGALDGIFTLLGIGRVPLTIWLAVFLFGFAAIGVSIQSLSDNLLGAPLYRWVAAIVAAAAALPLTGMLARPLGAILPKDETSAVSTDTLLGRRGTITDGIARRGSPARARVQDAHGQAHHVMVEPHEPSSEIYAGDEILLVRREGRQFYATALAERRLSPQA
jgi:membrane protein implicated in regulation of membrane protease activity